MRTVIYDLSGPVVFFALCLLITCEVQRSPAADLEAVASEAQQMLHDYHRDMGRSGLMAEFNYLDDSEDFFWVPPGYQTPLDYDSVRLIIERMAPTYHSVDFHWDTLRLYPLSADIANFAGIVKGVLVDTAGQLSKVTIIESGTVIRRADGWKLLSGQSAVVPDSTITVTTNSGQ